MLCPIIGANACKMKMPKLSCTSHIRPYKMNFSVRVFHLVTFTSVCDAQFHVGPFGHIYNYIYSQKIMTQNVQFLLDDLMLYAENCPKIQYSFA